MNHRKQKMTSNAKMKTSEDVVPHSRPTFHTFEWVARASSQPFGAILKNIQIQLSQELGDNLKFLI